jgi:hypothetical protein
MIALAFAPRMVFIVTQFFLPTVMFFASTFS